MQSKNISNHSNRWDALSIEYEKRVEPFTARFAERLLRPLVSEFDHPSTGKKLLDVGCGTGAVTLLALKAGMEVVATDVSETMVERTKERGLELLARQQPHHDKEDDNEEFQRIAQSLRESTAADGMDLPWSSPSSPRRFDVAVANFSLIFFSDPRRGLEEIYGCLHPGGTVAFSAFGGPSETPAFGVFPRVAREMLPADLAEKGKPRRIHGSVEGLTALLKQAGFVGVSVTRVVETLVVATPELYFDRFAKASPPVSDLLSRLDAPTRAAFKQRVLEVATETGGRPDGSVALDATAYLAYGRKA